MTRSVIDCPGDSPRGKIRGSPHFTRQVRLLISLAGEFCVNSLEIIMHSHTPPGSAGFDRTVFFVSDGTGIIAETFGHSVLTQFDLRFRQIRLPFIDTEDKAHEAVRRIDDALKIEGKRPIVFSTLVKSELSAIVRRADAMHMDLIQTFVEPLEQELGTASTHTIGRSHNIADSHDDGQSHKNLSSADVILVGVSRSGKTPTSLYMAMQYGIKAANYPLIPEDFERGQLPSGLMPFRSKVFGLSIAPDRLSEVRNERRPGSKYASLENCRYEVNEAERMMQREGIRWVSTTVKSIEEIATLILHELKIGKRSY